MKARIRKLVSGVHMGLGHVGLKELLKKPLGKGGADIDIEALAPGELVMCINGVGDKMKVIGHRGLVIGYLKMPHRQRIMREALQYIPHTFGGGGFDYDKACLRAIEERIGAVRTKVGPLEAARAAKAAGV